MLFFLFCLNFLFLHNAKIKYVYYNIKELRKQKGLSQEQVANSLGISMREYQNYEYGQREPNIEMINKLADFYHVSTDYLLGTVK